MMDIAQAKQQVKDAVEAYLEKDETGLPKIAPLHQRPLFLVGAPGIGKTAIVSQVASEMGIGLVSYSMTHHTRQSALGLPFIVHKEYGGKSFDVSEYTMSEIIASVYDYIQVTGLTRGILFLDEINCVSETLYPSMLQFLQFKTFGRHRIPDDWVVVCAGNPPEYNRSVHDFDIVTLDRVRKIEVETSFDAWREYARQTEVHPAITSYLDVRSEDFYLVESTPSGKAFVTARGWSDLSEMITLFDTLGKPVDKSLISQYLQEDGVASRFAQYMDLFAKYRSDYRVPDILAGNIDDAIVKRAQGAPFDERLALLGLMLDALGAQAREALHQERLVKDVQGTLKAAKPAIIAGESVEELLGANIVARTEAAARHEATNVADIEDIRCERHALELVKSLLELCKQNSTVQGQEAFAVLSEAYSREVQRLGDLVDGTQAALDNAFAFIDRSFQNDREMLVFVTELTYRRDLSQFILHFGSESYFARNNRLVTDTRRQDLLERIAELETQAQADEGKDAEMSEMREDAGENANTGERLSAYYAAIPSEDGFAGMCHMALPSGLRGATVLDVGCRKGQGVFKYSEAVGPDGRAIGVDPSPEYIEAAKAGTQKALVRNGLAQSNMEFRVGYPENTGQPDESVDVVYTNSSLNLAMDPAAALREMYRVLKPGGRLFVDGAVADAPRDADVVLAAKRIGNSVQAAPCRAEFEQLLGEVGFTHAVCRIEGKVSAHAGRTAAMVAPVATSDEQLTFYKAIVYAEKPAR